MRFRFSVPAAALPAAVLAFAPLLSAQEPEPGDSTEEDLNAALLDDRAALAAPVIEGATEVTVAVPETIRDEVVLVGVLHAGALVAEVDVPRGGEVTVALRSEAEVGEDVMLVDAARGES